MTPPRYRFTAEDFPISGDIKSGVQYHKEWFQQAIADTANALLEKWEAESEKVYGNLDGWSGAGTKNTHEAILWRPREIEGGE